MSQSNLELVAEFSRGFRFPLASVHNRHMQLIAHGMRRAFEDIQRHAPKLVEGGDERQVTVLMHARLSQLIFEDAKLGEFVA